MFTNPWNRVYSYTFKVTFVNTVIDPIDPDDDTDPVVIVTKPPIFSSDLTDLKLKQD